MTDDSQLARLYQVALERRGAAARQAVSVETVHALASGTYSGADRIEQLDRVLADPVLAAELDFFADLAAEAPAVRPSHGRWSLRWSLPLAATLVMVAGGTLLWKAMRDRTDDVMRSSEAGVALVLPETIGPGVPLAWGSVTGARSYEMEVLDADGQVVLRNEGPDTAVTVPASTTFVSGATYTWSVTARLADGRAIRSPLAILTAR